MKDFIKYTKYATERNSFLVLIAVTALLLLLPHFSGPLSSSPALIGREPYYHYRIAKSIMEEGGISYDYISYGGKPHLFNPYHYVLAGFFYFFTDRIAVWLLPFMLGILSVILFYKLLQMFKLPSAHRFFFLLIFVASPSFIHTFVLLNSASVAFLFSLLGFYFLLGKRKISFAASVMAFAPIVFFGLAYTLVTFLFLLVYSLIKENTPKEFFLNPKKKAATTALILFLISLLYYSPIYLEYGFPEKITFVEGNFFVSLLSDLGGNGFALFAVLLALSGLILTWGNKYVFWPVYLGALFLAILFFYTDSVSIYVNAAQSFFAAHALIILTKRKWEIPLLKNLTIFILLLGLSFSTVSYLDRMSDMAPEKNTAEGLKWLGKNSKPGIVLSHYSRGFWIEAMANRTAFMDESFIYAPDPNTRFEDSEKIFQGRNLDKTKYLLDKYSIDYIWIDEEMKNGLVWTKEQQGLLFLFRNNETFNNIYNTGGVEIWQVKR